VLGAGSPRPRREKKRECQEPRGEGAGLEGKKEIRDKGTGEGLCLPFKHPYVLCIHKGWTHTDGEEIIII
jgi:hypothetical protein